MKRSTKKETALILTVVMAAYLLSGCSFTANAAEEEAVPEDHSIEVVTGNPEVRTVSIESNFSGTIEAEDKIVVIPRVAGEVTEKYFEVGDHVNEGDLLFKIDDETAKIHVDEAKAQVDSAQAGYTAQQATNASTKAAATETIAKISSNTAQYDYAVDNAYAQKRSAGNRWESSSAAEDYYENEYYEAKDDLHDMKKKRKKLKSTRNDLEDLIDAYKSRESSEGTENANKWLKSKGFSSYSELKESYSSAASAYANADSAVDQYENSIQSYELQRKTNGYSADSYEMDYYTAEENVALAEQNRDIYNNFTKATTLFDVNAKVVGADADLIRSEASVRQAKVGLENAELTLDYYTVTAPVSGTITDIGVTLHNMATSATEAYTIETDSLSKVVFFVAEETVQSVKPGNEAVVTKNGKEYKARITNVGTTLDEETGLFKIEAVVTGSADRLLNGSTVSIRTVTRQENNVITVPGDVVYYDDEQAYVFVSDGKNAKRRDIVTGISDDNGIAVLDGLTTDDEVIVSWSSQLKDGSEINVTKSGKTTGNNADKDDTAVEKTITDPTEITAGSATVEAASEEMAEDALKSEKTTPAEGEE